MLPLTDRDLATIVLRTRQRALDIVRFVSRHAIEMDDEPEAFVRLRQGRRVMVLRHQHGGCFFLGDDARCSIYAFRPLGCRIFPFDPAFTDNGSLRRLRLIQGTECPHELDGRNRVAVLRNLHEAHTEATQAYYERIAEWNRLQRARLRSGRTAQTAAEYLEWLGVDRNSVARRRMRARGSLQSSRSYQVSQPK